MDQAQTATQVREGLGDIGRTVVGEHLAEADPQAGVVARGPEQRLPTVLWVMPSCWAICR